MFCEMEHLHIPLNDPSILAFSFIVGAVLMFVVWKYLTRPASEPKSQHSTSPTGLFVSEITIFPIKSCAGVSLKAQKLGPNGFLYDRKWMVVTESDGNFVSQRVYPKMALIRPTFGNGVLHVTAPGMPDIDIPLDGVNKKEPTRQVTIWKDSCMAIDEGDELAAWFTKYIGVPVRLVRAPENMNRIVEEKGRVPGELNTVDFADGYPFLLATEASLKKINEWAGCGDNTFTMRRFRPNIVISGAEPFAEDRWRKIEIGGHIFHLQKRCKRCKMTTVIPDEGIFGGTEPLATVKAKNNGTFGMNMIHSKKSIGTGAFPQLANFH